MKHKRNWSKVLKQGLQVLFHIVMAKFPIPENCSAHADFPKLAEKLSVIRTDRHENLVSPKNILPVRKKSPQKFSHMHNV